MFRMELKALTNHFINDGPPFRRFSEDTPSFPAALPSFRRRMAWVTSSSVNVNIQSHLIVLVGEDLEGRELG